MIIALISEVQVGAALSALTALLISVNLFLQKTNSRKAAAERVASRARLAGVVATLAKIHADSNGALGSVLRLYATSLRRVYEGSLTPADLKLAEAAEARANAHEALQADIEARRAKAEADFARMEKEQTDAE